MTTQLAEIREAHAREHHEWQLELRRAWSPGFGIFAGVGYAPAGSEVRFVVGIGLIRKIF